MLLSEIDRHLAAAKELFLGCGLPPDTEQVRKTGINFHTIKGGAGFFGFQALAGSAAEIERLLIKTEGPIAQRMKTIATKLLEFEKLVGELPKPSA